MKEISKKIIKWCALGEVIVAIWFFIWKLTDPDFDDITGIIIFLAAGLIIAIGFCVYAYFSMINNSNTQKNVAKKMQNMNITYTKEFEELFSKLYNKHNSYIESKRVIAAKKSLILKILLVPSVIGFISLETMHDADSVIPFTIFIICLPFIIAFLYLAIKYFKYFKEYNIYFKNNIVKSFINLLNPNIIYNPEIDENNKIKILDKFNTSRFGSINTNRIVAEDYIEFKYAEGLTLRWAEINTMHESTYTKMDGTVRSKTKYIFEGMFGSVLVGNDFEYPVRIFADDVIVDNTSGKIKVDSSDFENIYKVFSDNNIYALRFLTSDLIMLLVDFYNKYGIRLQISLINDYIYFSIPGLNLFEPGSYNKNPLQKENLFLYTEIINLIIKVVNEINKSACQILD